ncbi:hypothetical protein AAFN86_05450 [Roseomonas sp. CAU 1739]
MPAQRFTAPGMEWREQAWRWRHAETPMIGHDALPAAPDTAALARIRGGTAYALLGIRSCAADGRPT